MLKKSIIYKIVIIVICIILSDCSSLKYFFPIEHISYPIFGNGYEKKIRVVIIFNHDVEFNGLFSPGEIVWSRTDKYKFKSILIFGKESNLIAKYPAEYLNMLREAAKVVNEFWIAYEGGLVLIPEEYHKGDDWQEYIKTIKGK